MMIIPSIIAMQAAASAAGSMIKSATELRAAEANARAFRLDQEQRRKLNAAAPAPVFDKVAFQKMTAAGAEAWADVKDPVAWVREQRGGTQCPPAPQFDWNKSAKEAYKP